MAPLPPLIPRKFPWKSGTIPSPFLWKMVDLCNHYIMRDPGNEEFYPTFSQASIEEKEELAITLIELGLDYCDGFHPTCIKTFVKEQVEMRNKKPAP